MRDLLPPVLHHGARRGVRRRLPGRRTTTSVVGGDFYDVHPGVDPGRRSVLVVLGDVCGKGLEAAVLTGKIRNTLQALLPLADDHQRDPRACSTARC